MELVANSNFSKSCSSSHSHHFVTGKLCCYLRICNLVIARQNPSSIIVYFSLGNRKLVHS